MLLQTVPITVSPPFRLSAMPQEAFAHDSWQRAEQVALHRLAEGDCVLLLGASGTGKSLLLHRLAQALRLQGRTVRMLLDGEIPPDTQPGDVLLVDEADTLASERLEALCATVNPVVLAGPPPFLDRFETEGAAIGTVELERLSADEVARFVAGRLEAAGRPASMFGAQAVHALVVHSDGLFRILAILASASLFFAELRQAKEVTAADVDEAAAMRLAVMASEDEERPAGTVAAPTRARWSGWRRWSAWGVVAASCGVGLLAMSGAWRTPAPPPAPVGASTAAAVAEPVMTPVPGPAAPVIPSPAPPAAAPAQAVTAPASGPRRRAVAAYVGRVSGRSGEGKLRLRLRTDGAEGPVEAWVYGWDGFSASGRLQGALAPGGRVRLSGRLLLGRHEFDCDLQAVLDGDRLTGEASFLRPATGETARGSFSLSRS